MKDRIVRFIRNRGWGDLVLGAVIGLVLTSFAAPVLNTGVTKMYEGVGVYSPPDVTVDIQDTGEYHPVNHSVEDFGGLKWKEEYSVYRILIRNNGNKPVEQLKFTWRAPGCVVHSNMDGPTTGGHFSLSNRGTFKIFSNVSLSTEQYQCTKVVEVTEGELSPEESLAVEFVTTHQFEKCDVLIDLNPKNLHLLEYTWVKNGVPFEEQRVINPPHLESTYQEVQKKSFTGTRESLELSSGEYLHNFVVGVRGDSIESAVEKCVNSST